MTSSLIDRLNAVSEQVALKRPVRVASTVNLTLSGFQTVDGVTPVASDENLRVLVKNQMTSAENGIYLMTTGSWERTDDFDGNRDVVKGTRVPVTEGSIGANKTYVVTAADPIVIDQSGITFSEITESLVTSEFAKPRAAIVSITPSMLDQTLTAAEHAGKQIDVDCTATDRVITLPVAATMTDGDRITIRYAAGTNQIIIACQGADGINGASSLALTSRYESLTLATDGSNWAVVGHAKPFAAGSVVFIKAVSRTLLTPPVSPVPGARYIIAASGVLTGDWSSYANNDVVESNGQGGWIRYSPSESWHAYVEAENKLVFFTGTAWQGLPNTDDPARIESRLCAVSRCQKNDGVDGGSPAGSAWTARKLRRQLRTAITGASLASNAITFPAGKYLVIADALFLYQRRNPNRLKSTTTATVIHSPSDAIHPSRERRRRSTSCWCSRSAGSGSVQTRILGHRRRLSLVLGAIDDRKGATEYYATVQIIDLSSLQGGKGDPGDIGPQGFAGFKYQYSTDHDGRRAGKGLLEAQQSRFFFCGVGGNWLCLYRCTIGRTRYSRQS